MQQTHNICHSTFHSNSKNWQPLFLESTSLLILSNFIYSKKKVGGVRPVCKMEVVDSNSEEPVPTSDHKGVTITPSTTSKQDDNISSSNIKSLEDILEDLGTI